LIVRALFDDASELNGATIVKLLPSVRLSIRDQLTEAFDFINDGHIEFLGASTAPLEEQLKEWTKT
jgi:hypothetical protein